MSAIQLFRDQHKTIRGLFAQLDTVDARAHDRKEPILKQTFMELEVHFLLEEEFLYEAMRTKASTDANVELEHCYTAHGQVRNRIHAMRARDIHEEHFNIGLQTFIQDVAEHLDLEEHELFPLAKMLLGDQELESLEPRIQSKMKQLMQKPEYRDAQPSLTQNPNGGEQMRKKTA